MTLPRVIRSLLGLACLTVLVVPTLAQPDGEPEPRRYVEFPIARDVKALVEQRLAREKQLEPFKELIKKIAADPQGFPISAEKVKEMKLDNPQFKKALQDWLGTDPQLRQALKDWVEQNKTTQKPEHVKELKQILDEPPAKQEAPQTPSPAAIEPAKPKVDPLAKVAEKAMKQAENTQIGEWLRDSPAWQRAFEDLKTSLNNPKSSDWKLGDWSDRLRLTDPKVWQFGEAMAKRLQNLPQPNLERWNLNGLPPLGNFPSPNLAAPVMPNVGGSSLPSLSDSVTWALLVLLCLLVGWQMLRWTKRTIGVEDERAQLGPWPVRPEAVSTRAELVQAFDYLALLTLGLDVKSWNHHAVARGWRDRLPTSAATAQALALLYEQARYTNGAAELPAAERAQARQALVKLAQAM